MGDQGVVILWIKNKQTKKNVIGFELIGEV